MNCEFEDKIFSINEHGRESVTLDIFRFQYRNNEIYRQYVDALHINEQLVTRIDQIPFMPIQFFKTHRVNTSTSDGELLFESSGTTGITPSKHYIQHAAVYRKSFLLGFEHFYGSLNHWCIVGLLPSYLERQHSSLVMMVDEMIRKTGHPSSGFYLYEHEKLYATLQELESSGQQTLLIGVTYALLDFAEKYSFTMKNVQVMETGGMKGRRIELTRNAVHAQLKASFGLESIHSEYGMTELLSQAYSKGGGIFHCPPWMSVFARQEDDPFLVSNAGRGMLNIIDLANIYSCSFIETEDLGNVHANGSFEVIGRVDASDARGCSLMLSTIGN